MHATMMDVPLSLNHFLDRAATLSADSTIVSRLPDKSSRRHTYGRTGSPATAGRPANSGRSG